MDEKPSLDDLVHYGVPGMKWGVKKARTGDVAVATSRLDKIADKSASRLNKTIFFAFEATPYRMIKSGGVAKEAKRQSDLLKAHSERLATGQATFRDLVTAYTHVSLISVAKSMKKDES